jgi:hypothetical protein
MLGAALCYGFGAVYTKQRMSSAAAPTLAVGQQLAAGALLLLPALTQAPRTAPPAQAVWALVGLALLSTTLAFLLFFHLIARIGPTRTNSVTFLIPVFGITWGALVLGEPITGGMLGGFALILLALVLVNDYRPARRRPWRQPSTVGSPRGGQGGEPVAATERSVPPQGLQGVDLRRAPHRDPARQRRDQHEDGEAARKGSDVLDADAVQGPVTTSWIAASGCSPASVARMRGTTSAGHPSVRTAGPRLLQRRVIGK